MRVLSIDAWGNKTDGFEWNQWYVVGTYEGDLTPRKCLKWLRDQGRLGKIRCLCEDDGFNYVILERGTEKPRYAFAYGEGE
jgi:hypothetical protein